MIMTAKWYSKTFVGLKLPDICRTGEEKSRKTSPRKLVPTGNRIRARCVTGAHDTACSTAADVIIIIIIIIIINIVLILLVLSHDTV